MNRKFYLIERSYGTPAQRKTTIHRITMQYIVDYFNKQHPYGSPWNRNNVDLDRFREEMNKIPLEFVIEIGPERKSSRLISLEKRLKTARKKLKDLRESRPDGRGSDRACYRHMEKFFDQLDLVERLSKDVAYERAKQRKATRQRGRTQKN